MSTNFLAGQGALWIQPSGANSESFYLGCHQLGDLEKSLGDFTTLYCPDPSGPNKFKRKNKYRGEPGEISSSIETDVRKVRDYLEKVTCPFNLFVNMVDCGRKDVFSNWERSFILSEVDITSHSYSNLAIRAPDAQDEATQSVDFNALELYLAQDLAVARKTSVELEDMLDVAFIKDEVCESDCGIAKPAGTIGVTFAAGGAAAAEVYVTLDGGVTWAATVTQPFAIGENIMSGVIFPWNSGYRILCIRNAAALAPAEIAYTDDYGALAWTTVTIGTVNVEGALGPSSLFCLDSYHIWAVTENGIVYFTGDGGVTWTVQDDGSTTTAADLYAVHFLDDTYGFAVGAGDVLIRTQDGGNTWELAAATASAVDVISVQLVDKNDVWVSSGPNLYYSTDFGETWTARVVGGLAAGTFPDLKFTNKMVGFAIHNTAAPIGNIWETIDGGYSWKLLTYVANAGLTALEAVNSNLLWATGNVTVAPATAVVLKISD